MASFGFAVLATGFTTLVVFTAGFAKGFFLEVFFAGAFLAVAFFVLAESLVFVVAFFAEVFWYEENIFARIMAICHIG